MAPDDGTSTTYMPPLRRSVGALACLICFALVVVSAYDAVLTAVEDRAAGPALIGFVIALGPAVAATYGLVEALKQAVDGAPRTFHVAGALALALLLLAAGPLMLDVATD